MNSIVLRSYLRNGLQLSQMRRRKDKHPDIVRRLISTVLVHLQKEGEVKVGLSNLPSSTRRSENKRQVHLDGDILFRARFFSPKQHINTRQESDSIAERTSGRIDQR